MVSECYPKELLKKQVVEYLLRKGIFVKSGRVRYFDVYISFITYWVVNQYLFDWKFCYAVVRDDHVGKNFDFVNLVSKLQYEGIFYTISQYIG